MPTIDCIEEEKVADHNKMPYTYDRLIGDVEHIHKMTSSYAKGAVNQLLTARN